MLLEYKYSMLTRLSLEIPSSHQGLLVIIFSIIKSLFPVTLSTTCFLSAL